MHKFLTAALAATAFSALSGTASATIILVDASSIQGDNVLFNSGTQTNTLVLGATQSGTVVNFTGTTLTGPTLTANGGQARIEGDLTSLNFSLASGGTFNDLEFNLFQSDPVTATASFSIVDNAGDVFNFNNLALGTGSNFFGFQGINGESIRTVSYTINGGSIADQRQLRLTESSAVPEPTTWAMMLAGFGLVGAGMRRRKTEQRVRFAI